MKLWVYKFHGNINKMVKVKINSSNQNTLFGETLEISKLRVAKI